MESPSTTSQGAESSEYSLDGKCLLHPYSCDSLLDRNKTGPFVTGVRRALYAKVDSVEEGIEIVKSAIEEGTAIRV